MQQLIDALYERLNQRGVEFVFNCQETMNAELPVVVCLSARAAGDYLQTAAPDLSQALRATEMLSLGTVTCFYPPDAARLNGFGCLFPPDQGFRARGVLFNDSIFDGRGPAHAETWIFGGALDAEVVNLTEAEFANLIAAERERFYGVKNEPLAVHVTRWPRALPHYSLELERTLTTLPPPPANVALVGNYLGKIGLAKILERAACVADEWVRTPPAC
jgi:oxygen-dependent protoporphyrinogen oxidase